MTTTTPNTDAVSKDLILPLKGEYFDQIKRGEKVEEFRLCTPYWAKRLVGRQYRNVILTRGYPAKYETEKRITRHWKGYSVRTIAHPHFGDAPVEVFAINVRG